MLDDLRENIVRYFFLGLLAITLDVTMALLFRDAIVRQQSPVVFVGIVVVTLASVALFVCFLFPDEVAEGTKRFIADVRWLTGEFGKIRQALVLQEIVFIVLASTSLYGAWKIHFLVTIVTALLWFAVAVWWLRKDD